MMYCLINSPAPPPATHTTHQQHMTTTITFIFLIFAFSADVTNSASARRHSLF